MTQVTNVKQVKLNIMTQQQYTAATKNPTELYMVTDAQTGGSAVTFKDWRTQCTMTISVTNSSSYTISAFVIDGTNYLNELVEAGMSTTGSSSNISLSVPQGSATSTYKVVYDTSSEATGTIDISGSTATLSVSLT